MTINMRSVCNKFNEFIGHLSKLKGNITFILLTETWLSEAVDLLYEIPGYISYNMYRNGRGGGLKLYVLENLKFKVLQTPVTNCCEALLVSANVPRIGNIRVD